MGARTGALFTVALLVAAACGGGTKLTVVEEKLDRMFIAGAQVTGVYGTVRNDGGAPARNVVAIVEWLDADGKKVIGVADPTKPAEIAPGATATFALLAPPGDTRIKKYRLTFESK